MSAQAASQASSTRHHSAAAAAASDSSEATAHHTTTSPTTSASSAHHRAPAHHTTAPAETSYPTIGNAKFRHTYRNEHVVNIQTRKKIVFPWKVAPPDPDVITISQRLAEAKSDNKFSNALTETPVYRQVIEEPLYKPIHAASKIRMASDWDKSKGGHSAVHITGGAASVNGGGPSSIADVHNDQNMLHGSLSIRQLGSPRVSSASIGPDRAGGGGLARIAASIGPKATVHLALPGSNGAGSTAAAAAAIGGGAHSARGDHHHASGGLATLSGGPSSRQVVLDLTSMLHSELGLSQLQRGLTERLASTVLATARPGTTPAHIGPANSAPAPASSSSSSSPYSSSRSPLMSARVRSAAKTRPTAATTSSVTFSSTSLSHEPSLTSASATTARPLACTSSRPMTAAAAAGVGVNATSLLTSPDDLSTSAATRIHQLEQSKEAFVNTAALISHASSSSMLNRSAKKTYDALALTSGPLSSTHPLHDKQREARREAIRTSQVEGAGGLLDPATTRLGSASTVPPRDPRMLYRHPQPPMINNKPLQAFIQAAERARTAGPFAPNSSRPLSPPKSARPYDQLSYHPSSSSTSSSLVAFSARSHPLSLASTSSWSDPSEHFGAGSSSSSTTVVDVSNYLAAPPRVLPRNLTPRPPTTSFGSSHARALHPEQFTDLQLRQRMPRVGRYIRVLVPSYLNIAERTDDPDRDLSVVLPTSLRAAATIATTHASTASKAVFVGQQASPPVSPRRPRGSNVHGAENGPRQGQSEESKRNDAMAELVTLGAKRSQEMFEGSLVLHKRMINDSIVRAEACRRAGRPRAEANALLTTGVLLENIGIRLKAVQSYERFIECMKACNDVYMQCLGYNNIGIALMSLGPAHLADAAAAHQQHLALADPAGKYIAYTNLGLVQSLQGDYEAAVNCHKLALKLAIDLNSPAMQAAALANVGLALAAIDDLGGAQACLERQLEMMKGITRNYTNDKMPLRAVLADHSKVLQVLADIAARKRDLESARTYYLRAHEAAQSAGDAATVDKIRTALGIVQGTIDAEARMARMFGNPYQSPTSSSQQQQSAYPHHDDYDDAYAPEGYGDQYGANVYEVTETHLNGSDDVYEHQHQQYDHRREKSEDELNQSAEGYDQHYEGHGDN